jgi:hypothetical protein
MDKEFHYWVTGIVAESAGFPSHESRIIAYSSQFTDDNNRVMEIFDDEFDVTPSYVTHVSQTEDITQPQRDIMRIYPLFHFVPGDKDKAAPRNDGKTHALLTTPDSSYANQIMGYTLKNAVARYLAGDKSCLHRIGIASHCYVDTWAHQNFIGWYDDMNGLPDIPLLNIGHFDAKHHPDRVNHSWQDPRLATPDIVNNQRFIVAAQRLYEQLSGFCQQVSVAPVRSWAELDTFLQNTWAEPEPARIDRYRNYSPALHDYDDLAWEMAAFDKVNVPVNGASVEKCIWKSHLDKTTADWYLFQEAVKSHIVDASTICRPAFSQAGIHI